MVREVVAIEGNLAICSTGTVLMGAFELDQIIVGWLGCYPLPNCHGPKSSCLVKELTESDSRAEPLLTTGYHSDLKLTHN
jgi:hypothetical protein